VAVVQTQQWTQILDGIRSRIGAKRFRLWFENTQLLALDESLCEVGVANLFIRDWIEQHFKDIILDTVTQVTGLTPELALKIEGSLFRKMRAQQKKDSETVKKEDVVPRTPARPAEPSLLLRKNLTLENFVVGECNRFAYMAAKRVARSLGTAYNPFFVYGGVGLGKTHLIQGICNELVAQSPGTRVVYVSAESFTNEFIGAIRTNSSQAFRNKYRETDVLVIDDIHFLANKAATQDEFFHTFNALERLNKQVVMASDSHPKTIKKLKENLVTRFVAGMVAKLNPPDYATRVKIIKAKIKQHQQRFSSDIVQFLARHFTKNVRELEGAITKLAAFSSLSGGALTQDEVRELMADHIEKSDLITVSQIDGLVCKHFGVAPADLKSKRRTRAISVPRRICMYLARTLTDCSCKEIGQYFGGKSHASVIFAANSVANEMEANPELKALIDKFSAELSY
jgi:chromosomal replication initiator protein